MTRHTTSEFVPFLDHDIEIRRVLCSTNTIGSVDARSRRAMRWKPALNAFAITFEGRITPNGNQPMPRLDLPLIRDSPTWQTQRRQPPAAWNITSGVKPRPATEG